MNLMQKVARWGLLLRCFFSGVCTEHVQFKDEGWWCSECYRAELIRKREKEHAKALKREQLLQRLQASNLASKAT